MKIVAHIRGRQAVEAEVHFLAQDARRRGRDARYHVRRERSDLSRAFKGQHYTYSAALRPTYYIIESGAHRSSGGAA